MWIRIFRTPNYTLLGMISLIGIFLLPFVFPYIIFFLLLLGVVFFVVPEIQIMSKDEGIFEERFGSSLFFQTIILTSWHVVYYDGIMNKRRVEITYQAIKNFRIEDNIFLKILGISSILIEIDEKKIKMYGITNPQEIYNIIRNKMNIINSDYENKMKEAFKFCIEVLSGSKNQKLLTGKEV